MKQPTSHPLRFVLPVLLYLHKARGHVTSKGLDDSGVGALTECSAFAFGCHGLALVEVGYWRGGLVLLCLCTRGSVLKHGPIEVLSNANKESDLLGYPVL